MACKGIYTENLTVGSHSSSRGKGSCPGFGWDRVKSLSSWDSAGFWIYGENNVDNTLMF